MKIDQISWWPGFSILALTEKGLLSEDDIRITFPNSCDITIVSDQDAFNSQLQDSENEFDCVICPLYFTDNHVSNIFYLRDIMSYLPPYFPLFLALQFEFSGRTKIRYFHSANHPSLIKAIEVATKYSNRVILLTLSQKNEKMFKGTKLRIVGAKLVKSILKLK
jgi:hypothetical protein